MDEDRLEDETLQIAKKIARLDYAVLGLAKKVSSNFLIIPVILLTIVGIDRLSTRSRRCLLK